MHLTCLGLQVLPCGASAEHGEAGAESKRGVGRAAAAEVACAVSCIEYDIHHAVPVLP